MQLLSIVAHVTATMLVVSVWSASTFDFFLASIVCSKCFLFMKMHMLL